MRIEEDLAGDSKSSKTANSQNRMSPQVGDGSDLAAVAAALWPLSAYPFREIGTVGKLLDRGLPPDSWLNSCGVYAIVVPNDYEFGLLDFETVADRMNVLAPLSSERLRAKWVKSSRVVYIGFAGNTNPRSLRQRLKDLIRHASGDTTDRGPHRSGESIWQLADYDTFMVMAAPTAEPPAPRELEATLLERFGKRHGALPFGNRAPSEPEPARSPDVPEGKAGAMSPPIQRAPASPSVGSKPDPAAPSAETYESENMVAPGVKTPLSRAIDRAFVRAHSVVVLEALRAAPSETTIGELMRSLEEHGLADAFLDLTIGAIRTEAADAPPVDDEAARPKPVPPARPAPVASAKRLVTRTRSGRETLDGEIETVLKKAGRMKAEVLRAQVGGTPTQVRESLKRLMSLDLVRTEGERRATTYIWSSDK